MVILVKWPHGKCVGSRRKMLDHLCLNQMELNKSTPNDSDRVDTTNSVMIPIRWKLDNKYITENLNTNYGAKEKLALCKAALAIALKSTTAIPFGGVVRDLLVHKLGAEEYYKYVMSLDGYGCDYQREYMNKKVHSSTHISRNMLPDDIDLLICVDDIGDEDELERHLDILKMDMNSLGTFLDKHEKWVDYIPNVHDFTMRVKKLRLDHTRTSLHEGTRLLSLKMDLVFINKDDKKAFFNQIPFAIDKLTLEPNWSPDEETLKLNKSVNELFTFDGLTEDIYNDVQPLKTRVLNIKLSKDAEPKAKETYWRLFLLRIVKKMGRGWTVENVPFKIDGWFIVFNDGSKGSLLDTLYSIPNPTIAPEPGTCIHYSEDGIISPGKTLYSMEDFVN